MTMPQTREMALQTLSQKYIHRAHPYSTPKSTPTPLVRTYFMDGTIPSSIPITVQSIQQQVIMLTVNINSQKVNQHITVQSLI